MTSMQKTSRVDVITGTYQRSIIRDIFNLHTCLSKGAVSQEFNECFMNRTIRIPQVRFFEHPREAQANEQRHVGDHAYDR